MSKAPTTVNYGSPHLIAEEAAVERSAALKPGRQTSIAEAVVLRVLDITIATIVLVVTLPLMIVLAVIIKLDSPGPAVFRQRRVARGERTFGFVKFRTMFVDAQERFPELYAYRYSDEEVMTLYFKKQGDPRLTRCGRWLRKTSLDELPNFVNVLLGQMTLVGPRPEIPQMLPYYTEEQRLKFTVKPGLTGKAQINGRGLLSFLDTVEMDCRYVKERTLRGDIAVIWGTLRAIVSGPGAF